MEHRLFPIVNDMVIDIIAAADGRTIERRRRASRRAVAAWHAMTAQAKDQLIAHLTSTDPDALRLRGASLIFFRYKPSPDWGSAFGGIDVFGMPE